MLERNLTYLAVPYSHEDPTIRKHRFEMVSRAGAWLMQHGHIVYSPISHCHPMAKYGLPKGWQFWQHYDLTFLQYSRLFVVLPLDGWHKSIGLNGEYKEAKRLELPSMYIEGDLTTCEPSQLKLTWARPQVVVK